jgi:drug/metabolite transporter (DMT)-like permease
VFGLVSTCLVHLGKAMERQGIEIFSRTKNTTIQRKKPLIYTVGFALHNSVVLWQLIALQFSSAAVFSCVFGVGLIVLLLYSRYFLGEQISRSELIGALSIVIGTVIIGVVLLGEPAPSETVNFLNLYVLLIVLVVIIGVSVGVSLKSKAGIAIVFGICAGILGSLDNALKRIGLQKGIDNVGNGQTLPFFVLSFVAGASALIMCQVAFVKKAEASKLVPAYNSVYVAFPIVLELVIFETYYVSVWKVVALAFIVAGMLLTNGFNANKTDRALFLKALLVLQEYVATSVKSFKTLAVLEREMRKKMTIKIPEIEQNFSLLFQELVEELINQKVLVKMNYKSKDAVKKIKKGDYLLEPIFMRKK